nr:hypothetical protein [Octadecabacter sp.]
ISLEIVTEFCIAHVCLLASKLGKKVSTILGAIQSELVNGDSRQLTVADTLSKRFCQLRY